MPAWSKSLRGNKKMTFKKTMAVLLLLFCPLLVQAGGTLDLDTTDKRFYWGMQIGQGKEVEMNVGMFHMGYDFSNWLAIEAHVGKGSRLALTDPSGDFLNLSTDYLAAAFVRLNLRYEKVTWYIMGGASTLQINGDYDITNGAAGITGSLGTFFNLNGLAATGNFDDRINGTAYGGGFEFYGSRNTALSLNWIRYFDSSDAGALSVLSLGFVHHFDWPNTASRY